MLLLRSSLIKITLRYTYTTYYYTTNEQKNRRQYINNFRLGMNQSTYFVRTHMASTKGPSFMPELCYLSFFLVESITPNNINALCHLVS